MRSFVRRVKDDPHGDAMETACIRMHFQIVKYPMPMMANSFYDSRFTARYGDGSTALLLEGD